MPNTETCRTFLEIMGPCRCRKEASAAEMVVITSTSELSSATSSARSRITCRYSHQFDSERKPILASHPHFPPPPFLPQPVHPPQIRKKHILASNWMRAASPLISIPFPSPSPSSIPTGPALPPTSARSTDADFWNSAGSSVNSPSRHTPTSTSWVKLSAASSWLQVGGQGREGAGERTMVRRGMKG